ncbi:MAG: hypothetical protein ACREIC_32870 [Limisphaerales bacterium]
MSILDVEEIKIALPVRLFFLQRSWAKAHFNPGADAVGSDPGFGHIVQILVTGN